MQLKPFLPFVALVLILAACDVAKEPQQLKSFFDLADYFQQENDKLSSIKKIRKTVGINGKKEEKVLDNFDLKKDLEVFIQSNINKIIWLDKYRVDSTFNESNQLTRIQYLATDDKLKTRKMEILFENNKEVAIFIYNYSSNAIASSKQELHYHSNGYSMANTQNISLTTEQTRTVEVVFLN